MLEGQTLADAAEARVRDFAGSRNAPLTYGQPTPREQASIDRLIGARIAEARGLADLSIHALAAHAGVPSNDLRKIEIGQAQASVWLLARVATLTATSLDYLAGLNDESEAGEAPTFRALLLPHLLRADEQRAIQRLELQRQRRQIYAVGGLSGAAQQALQRVIELNPDTWPDMRGGARLVAALAACVRDAGQLGSATTE